MRCVRSSETKPFSRWRRKRLPSPNTLRLRREDAAPIPADLMRARTYLFNTHCLLGALFALLASSGCQLVKLRDESRLFYRATVLVGRVTPPDNWWGPVIVAATTHQNGRSAIAHQVTLHEPGGFELIVPDGRYTLCAFGDLNGNGRPDPGEPNAVHASPIEVANQGLVMLLDITHAQRPGSSALWLTMPLHIRVLSCPFVVPPPSAQAPITPPALSLKNRSHTRLHTNVRTQTHPCSSASICG
jgi:hypothetical protein